MYKKIMKTIVMAGLVALTFGSVPAWAEEESPVSASADIGIFSQYVWRGYAFSDDSIIMQPSATVSYGGVGFNLWGNLDTDYGDDADFNETDMTLSYDWSYDTVSMGVGYIFYGLEGEDSQEIYFTVGFDTILAPSITVYRDIDAFEGWYLSLGVGHSIALTEEVALDLSASIGYYDLDDVDYSELHDGTIAASITYAVNDYISITPSLTYTFGLSGNAKDDIEAVSADGESDHFIGGVTCSIAF